MFSRRNLLGCAALSVIALTVPAVAKDLPNAVPAVAKDLSNLSREKVQLVAPPFIHPHEQATKHGPRIIEFTMDVQEKEIVIDDDGTKIHAMTFNGSIPGPMMVVIFEDRNVSSAQQIAYIADQQVIGRFQVMAQKDEEVTVSLGGQVLDIFPLAFGYAEPEHGAHTGFHLVRQIVGAGPKNNVFVITA